MEKKTKSIPNNTEELKGFLNLDNIPKHKQNNLGETSALPQLNSTEDFPTNELLSWSQDKMDSIFGDAWSSILKHARDNDITVKNLIAITGKDTRKTTVWIMFKWWLLNRYPYLNGFLLRDTIVKSQSQMRMQLRKTANMIENEYGVSGFNDYVQESSDGLYLVRNNNAKDNQKVELLSFDSIVELGGFTTNNGGPAIFIYDELQNPNSASKEIISKEKFLANYKFIAEKNEAIEISSGKILPKWIPRHIFLSNRYVGKYPLNDFAETHLPFYDDVDEEGNIIRGVKTWMLEDPMDNNFIATFVTKDNVKEGWEDLTDTCIVYASKLSNMILRANKEWEDKQLALIKRGNPEDLAVIIGDLFEGYVNDMPTYFYTRKEKVSEEFFTTNHANNIEQVYLCMDLDFSRQIVMSAKYIGKVNGKTKVFRDKIVTIKCDGVSADGSKTELYLRKTYNEVIKYCIRIRNMMPHIIKVNILMDDKKAQWVGRFNRGEYANNYYIAQKITFDQTWPISQRPKDIDFLQDTGAIIDIEHPTLTKLHMYMSSSYAAPISSQTGKVIYKRIEKANDDTIDYINQDEYPLYFVKGKVKTELLNEKE